MSNGNLFCTASLADDRPGAAPCPSKRVVDLYEQSAIARCARTSRPGSTASRPLHAATGLLLGAAFIAAPALAQSPGAGTDQSNLVYEVQELRDEIRALRGLVEQQQIELENLRRRQRDQYLDLDQRLSELRANSGATDDTAVAGTPPNGSSSGSPTPASPPDSEQPGAQQGAPQVRQRPADDREVAALDRPERSETSQAPAAPTDVKDAYDRAFADLKALRYDRSAQKFSDFLGNHPDSEYADNAQYWLGESFYAVGNYGQALEAFDQLLSRYPDSPKAKDALLKIGYTHYEMENWDQARAALERVQQQYPDSTVARLAQNRLRTMRMEGHFE